MIFIGNFRILINKNWNILTSGVYPDNWVELNFSSPIYKFLRVGMLEIRYLLPLPNISYNDKSTGIKL